MKKVLIVVMITLLTSPILAQQGSIAFVNKTATKLVTASGGSGKLIFIDMTATWCAPCKEMEDLSGKRITSDPKRDKRIKQHRTAQDRLLFQR